MILYINVYIIVYSLFLIIGLFSLTTFVSYQYANHNTKDNIAFARKMSFAIKMNLFYSILMTFLIMFCYY